MNLAKLEADKILKEDILIIEDLHVEVSKEKVKEWYLNWLGNLEGKTKLKANDAIQGPFGYPYYWQLVKGLQLTGSSLTGHLPSINPFANTASKKE